MANGDGTWRDMDSWAKEVKAGLKREQEFMDGARKGPEQESVITSKVLNWGWLSIWRHINQRFKAPELHIYLKVPFSRVTLWDPAWDVMRTGRAALFLAFGRIPMAKYQWHARGGVVRYDISKYSGRFVR